MRHVTITRGEERKTYRVPSVDDWAQVTGSVAARLKPGDILALSGPLGAGKTTFVQSLARRLGVQRVTPSPTFALLRSYRLSREKNGIKRLLHVDAYRIDDERDLIALDLDEELADGKSVLVVEWAERIPKWLRHRQAIGIVIQSD